MERDTEPTPPAAASRNNAANVPGDEAVRNEVAGNLRGQRARVRLSQGRLAEAIGVSIDTISRWENAACDIDIPSAVRLCRALGMSVPDLLGPFAHGP